MEDSKEITDTLIEVYRANDWFANFKFRMLFYFSKMSSLPKDVKLLDCGCGTGHFLRFLQRHGFNNVYGIDASVKMVEYARNLTRGHIECADVLHMSDIFGSDIFDIITAISLQHHIGREEEWRRFIQECQKTIKPKGLLFFREPYLSLSFNSLRWLAKNSFLFKTKFLQGRFKALREEKVLLDYFLKHWPKYYERCLEANGFEIVKKFFCIGHIIVVSQANP